MKNCIDFTINNAVSVVVYAVNNGYRYDIYQRKLDGDAVSPIATDVCRTDSLKTALIAAANATAMLIRSAS